MNRKNYSDLEPRIKDALQSQADRLYRLYESDPARGEAFLRRVSRRIDATQSTRGEKIMNHRFRNVLVAAGAMCILGSAAVMASGGFVHWISGSSSRDEISSYEELAAMGEQHGVPFTINAPDVYKRQARRQKPKQRRRVQTARYTRSAFSSWYSTRLLTKRMRDLSQRWTTPALRMRLTSRTRPTSSPPARPWLRNL